MDYGEREDIGERGTVGLADLFRDPPKIKPNGRIVKLGLEFSESKQKSFKTLEEIAQERKAANRFRNQKYRQRKKELQDDR